MWKLFNFKTRKELKYEIQAKQNVLAHINFRLEQANAFNKLQTEKIGWYEEIFNNAVFENNTTTFPEGAKTAVLSIAEIVPATSPEEVNDLEDQNEVTTDTGITIADGVKMKHNASVFCDDDNSYVYLSKKLTEGYTHLSINFAYGKLRFILNDAGIGLEIDSNNRLKNKTVLAFLQEYFGLKNGKNCIFFEKI